MESDIAHGTDLLPHLYHERGDKEQQQTIVQNIPEEVLVDDSWGNARNWNTLTKRKKRWISKFFVGSMFIIFQ